MDNQVTFCKNCGREMLKGAAFCTYCGAKVEEEAPTPSYEQFYAYPQGDNTAPSYAKPSYTPPTPPRKRSKAWLWVIIAISAAIITGLIIWGAVALLNPDPDLTPVAEPASGTILSGSKGYGSEITIVATETESVVVSLKTSSGKEVVTFYVRAGDTVTIDVPEQKMYVYFATGKTWYGEEEMFGKRTKYYKEESITNFAYYTWEYQMGSFLFTDLDIVEIDKEEFLD